MSEQFTLETPKGRLSVHAFASAEEIGRLSFDPQFREHTGFRSIYTRGETLMRRAAEEDSNVVLAVTDKEIIIGFGVLALPNPNERWASLGPKAIMELKAIEVCRDWRQMGVGGVLVKAMLLHRGVEEKIIYLTGYTWIWDLKGAKMTSSQYRKMMIRLFQPFGFHECVTNEPNVSLDANNLFMCRVGENTSERLRDDFKWLLFGVHPR